MKRRLLFILCMTLVAIAVAGYAFAEQTELKPWQTAYLNVLAEKRDERNEIIASRLDDEYLMEYYALYDIDKDGTPELFLLCVSEHDVGPKCYLYRFTDGAASFVDEFYHWECYFYSVPERNGVLNVYQHMGHARGDLLTLTDGVLNSDLYFEEIVKAMYSPVSTFCRGAEYITEFRYYQDYPIIAYDIWSQPVQAVEEARYPDDNPNFFTNLFIENADVIRVRFPQPWLDPANCEAETMGVRDLQESLYYRSGFSARDPDSESENTGEYETFLADLDHDGQLEFLLTFHTEKGVNNSHQFTIILSEQNGTVYAYVEEFYACDDVDSKGVLYRYHKEGKFISESAYRVFFDAENCLSMFCNLDKYSGKRYERKEIVGYNMVHYGTQTATSPHYRMFRNYSINEEYGKYGARESYGEKHFTRIVDADMLANAKTYEPETLIQGEYAGYQKGTETAYSFGDDKYVWFIESPVYG